MDKEQIIKEYHGKLLAKAREKYKSMFASPEDRSEHYRKLQKKSVKSRKKGLK
jgi:hypothetical protein